MKNSFSVFFTGLVALIPLVVSGPISGGALSSSREPTVPEFAPSLARRDACPKACARKCDTIWEFRNEKDACVCNACKIGEKTNKKGDGCVKDKKWADDRGNCLLGSVLDPAEGGQDKNTAKPVCIPDDRSLCPVDYVWQSRDNGNNDILDSTLCAPKPKPKSCNKKNEYKYYKITNGVAEIFCKDTR
jgi:hypothetical protein